MKQVLQQSIVVFGEVLFDRFEDGSEILGGAPFNVAWHLQAFNQSPVFISRVGVDRMSATIRQSMQAWGMALQGLQTDPTLSTGSVTVALQEGEPRYTIVPNQAYDFINAGELSEVANQGLLYHGSLALRHHVSRDALNSLKTRHQGLIFLDVNLRAPWWQAGEVLNFLADANWVKLNQDEFDVLFHGEETLFVRMQACLQAYELQGLIVTRGEQGACAILANGEVLTVAPSAQTQVVDCVGAGDAFAAVLMLGIIKQWPMMLTMQRAQEFASALVGQRGATVQNRRFYQRFIEDWSLKV